MSRFVLAAGLTALVADARRMKQAGEMESVEEVTAGVLVSAPAGYEELSGKCSGRWIEVWADGHFAHYGEDHHIDSLDDCADTCDQHPECAGFYTKNGKCSHWRSGQVSARPQAGHTCYRKIGGGAPAPPAHHHHHGGGGGGSHASASCDPLPGYNVAPGKCSGRWIETWRDGHFAHYGEDHHISGVSDCADTCDQHSECNGFYTKNGKCSHWRSGSINVRPQAGHCCYTKAGGSFLEDEAEAEAAIPDSEWTAREALMRQYIHARHENRVDDVLELLTSDCHYHISAIVAGVGEHNYRGHSQIREYLRNNRVEDDEISGDEAAAMHPSHRRGDKLRITFSHWEGTSWVGVWVGVFAEFEFRGTAAGGDLMISKITAGADTR